MPKTWAIIVLLWLDFLSAWLGVSREQFIKPKKIIEGANEDGAVV